MPPARLFDEVLKLFLSGFGAKSYELLQQYGLFEHLFPQSAAAFALPPYAYAADMLELGLANTDARIAADKPVTPTFLFAVLLWSAVLRELNERQAGPTPDIALLMQACDSVLKTQQSRVSIPRRFSIPMRELLMLQPRFNRRSGVKSLSLLQHLAFVPPMIFSCCARKPELRIRSWRSGGPIFKCCRKRSGWRWCRRGRLNPQPKERRRPGGGGRRRRRGGAARS